MSPKTAQAINTLSGVVVGGEICTAICTEREKKGMEALHLHRVLPMPVPQNSIFWRSIATQLTTIPIARPPLLWKSASTSQICTARAGWFLGLGADTKKTNLPDTVKAGDPVLHEPAREVDPSEIKSEKVQKTIDDMIRVMRKAPGVGLAAPQIGIPFRVCSIFLNFVFYMFPILCLFHFYNCTLTCNVLVV